MKRALSILIAVSVLLSCGMAQAAQPSPGVSKQPPQLVMTVSQRPWGYYAADGGFSDDPKDYRVVVNGAAGPDEDGLYEVSIRGQLPSGVSQVDMLIRTILADDEPFLYPGAPEGHPGWRVLEDTECSVNGSEFNCTHRTVPAVFIDGNLDGVRVEVMIFDRSTEDIIPTTDYACSGAGGSTTCHWIEETTLNYILTGSHSPSLLSGTMPVLFLMSSSNLSLKAKRLIMRSPKPMKGVEMIVR